MELYFWLRGFVLGFSIAAPVGPIGLLCIRRTLTGGFWEGFLTGLGAATADAFYGSIAGFGLTQLSALLFSAGPWLRILGGAFLCYLGIRYILFRRVRREAKAPAGGLAGAYGSALFLTLTNPVTILAFAAMFAGLGLPAAGSYRAAISLVAGVFCGSITWWLILSASVSILRLRMTPALMAWINRLSGFILLGFGVWALGSQLGLSWAER
ncbi:MAG: LysE family translocator [Anaerolineae bacterium]